MSDCLLGIFPTKQQETDVRVREDIFDDPFDAEVFSMHGPDNRETIRAALRETYSKSLSVESTDRDRRSVAHDIVLSG